MLGIVSGEAPTALAAAVAGDAFVLPGKIAWLGSYTSGVTSGAKFRCNRDVGTTSPRTSNGYTATFALLQVSIVAVNSLIRSGSSANPAVNRIKLFLPGIAERFFARSRTESSRVDAA